MTPVETGGEAIEPAWDSFGIRRTDFRPNWNGDYVNVFSTVEPQSSEEATGTYMQDCARKLAEWVLANRDRFGVEDRFQIIVGWPTSVRETNRQAIKTGGTYDELQQIVDGQKPVELRRAWSSGVFGTNGREQDADDQAAAAVE
jgi:hypothetical protein